jgi:hypothetical protein
MSEETPVAPEMDPQGEPMPVTPHATIIRQGLLRTAALGGILAGMSLCGCDTDTHVAGNMGRPPKLRHAPTTSCNEPEADTELDVNCPATPGGLRAPRLEQKEPPETESTNESAPDPQSKPLQP